MSKLTKLLLTGFSVFLFVLIMVTHGLPVLVNPNSYKADIAAMIKKRTGRDVVFKGGISFAVLPWISLSADKVEISNKPGFQELPFMTVEQGEVRIKLLPLFRRKVEISSIVLKGLVLNLIKDGESANNWDQLLVSNLVSQSGIASAKNDDTSTGQSLLTGLSVGSINIKGARILLDNRKTGEHLELKNIALDIDKFAFGEQVQINMALDISGDFVKFPLSVKAATGLNIDERRERLVLRDSHIEGRGNNRLTKGQSLAATLTIPVTEVNSVQQSLNIPSLVLKSGDLKLAAEISGGQIIDKPSIRGSVVIDPFEPRKAIRQWIIEVPPVGDVSALANLRINFAFEADPDQAEFTNLDIVLDNSHGAGSVTVKNFKHPELFFNLAVDNINVDRYLAPQGQITAASSSTAFAAEKYTLPLGLLSRWDSEGNLTVGKMTFNNMAMQDMRLKLSSKKGIVKIGLR